MYFSLYKAKIDGPEDQFQYLNDQKKLFPSLQDTYLLLYSIYFELWVGYETFTNCIPSFSFLYIATVKPRLPAEYIDLKFFFTAYSTSFYCYSTTNLLITFENSFQYHKCDYLLDARRQLTASYKIILVRLSVRLSVCPYVTKFSQDWAISFF